MNLLPHNISNIRQKTTLMCHAVSKGYINIVKILLNHKADVNKPQWDQKTPLHLASMNGNLELVKLLLRNDSDVDVWDIFSMTPLKYAEEGLKDHKGKEKEAAYEKIVELLNGHLSKGETKELSGQCSICLQDIVESEVSLVLKCGHYFHKICIIAYKQISDTYATCPLCPLCRGSLLPGSVKDARREILSKRKCSKDSQDSSDSIKRCKLSN